MYVQYNADIMRRTYAAITYDEFTSSGGKIVPGVNDEMGAPLRESQLVSLWAMSSEITDHGGASDVVASEYPDCPDGILYDEIENFESQIWTAICVTMAIRALESDAQALTYEKALAVTEITFKTERDEYQARVKRANEYAA